MEEKVVHKIHSHRMHFKVPLAFAYQLIERKLERSKLLIQFLHVSGFYNGNPGKPLVSLLLYYDHNLSQLVLKLKVLHYVRALLL